MNPKALFVILTLLVLFFAGSIGWGFSRDSAQLSDFPPSWVEGLGELFVSRQPLQAEEVNAAIPPECGQLLEQDSLLLAENSSCTLFINPSSAPVRTLQLKLTAGVSAQVSLNHYGEGKLDAKYTLQGEHCQDDVPSSEEGGEQQKEAHCTADLQLFEEGGEVRIWCISDSCKLEIGD